MKTYNDYAQLAHDNGLSCHHVTGGMNGYPTPYLGAFIDGFENYQEAEKFKEEHGGEIIVSRTRAGWSVVEKYGYRNEPFEARHYVEDLGDNYEEVTPQDVKDWIADYSSDDEPNEKALKNLAELLEKAKEDEAKGLATVAYGTEYHDSVAKTMMGYSEDVWGWSIGVFFDHEEETSELLDE